MSFFVAKNEGIAERMLDVDPLRKLYPDYYEPRMDAIQELRGLDDGTLHKGSEWRRVASFVNVPLFNAVTTLLDPEFMQSKKRFYRWLRLNKKFCTYDIRVQKLSPTTTYIDGKAVT